MLTIQASTINPEDIDTKQEDHIADEFRYACMARPVAPRKVNKIPSGSFMAERSRLLRARKMARGKGISLEQAYAKLR